MGTQRSYEDFDLVIEPADDGGYRVRVAESPAGEASGAFAMPFSDLEMENFLLKVGRPRRGTRRLESPEMEAARDFGGRLFKAVFTDDIRLCLRRSLDETERSGEGLRIRLRLNDAPGLVNVPWEYLYNESADRFLVLSSWTPIVRYPDLPQPIRPISIEAPLRILAVISSPSDYETLDVSGEAQRIKTSLADLEAAGSVVVDTLEDATLLELQRKLRQTDYHVLHFIGHGGFDKAADDGVLMFEDDSGKSRIVSGRDLGTILADQRSLRLAVLNACDGARASSEDPFAGSAQSLIRQGLPAVVAMQFEITDKAAIAFAHEFYAAIADGSPVDAAVAEGRRAIFGQGNDIEWGTPVLYMRSPDGTLFDISAAPASAQDTAPTVPPDAPTLPAPDEPDAAPEAGAAEEAVGDDQGIDAPGDGDGSTRMVEPESVPAAKSEDPAPTPPEADSPPPSGADTRPTPVPEPEPAVPRPAPPVRPQPASAPQRPPWAKIGGGVAAVALVASVGIALSGGGDAPPTTTTEATTTTEISTTSVPPVTTIIVAEPGTAVAEAFISPPVIDGSDGDWDVTTRHETPELVFRNSLIQNGSITRLGSNSTAEVSLGWDDNNLYVFASVRDDIVSQPNAGNQIWRGDAITLNIAIGDQRATASEDPDANDFQVTLSPGDPAAGTSPGSVIFSGSGGRFGSDRTGLAEVASRFNEGDSSWMLEARIPWQALNVSDPATAGPFGMLVALFDNDGELEADGSRSLQAVILGNTPDAVFQGPATWGTLTLER